MKTHEHDLVEVISADGVFELILYLNAIYLNCQNITAKSSIYKGIERKMSHNHYHRLK